MRLRVRRRWQERTWEVGGGQGEGRRESLLVSLLRSSGNSLTCALWRGVCGGEGWSVGTLSGADLSGVWVGVVQAQQQQGETLQHQLPQGAAEPHSGHPAAPHQRPEQPDCGGADRGQACTGGGAIRSRQGEGAIRSRQERASGGLQSSGSALGAPAGPGRGAGEGAGGVVGKTAGGGGRGSRRPGAVGGVAPRSGTARAPAAAARPLRSAPSAASTSRGSPSPSAPRSAGSSVVAWRTCGVQGLVEAPRPAPPRPARPLTFPQFQRQVAEARQGPASTVGSGSPCQARSRSRTSPPPPGAAQWAGSQQLGGGHWVNALAFCAGQSRLGPSCHPHPSWRAGSPR